MLIYISTVFVPVIVSASSLTASSDVIVIHEPTGFLGIDTIYYVIAVISLGVISLGIIGIKKYV